MAMMYKNVHSHDVSGNQKADKIYYNGLRYSINLRQVLYMEHYFLCNTQMYCCAYLVLNIAN